MGVASPGEPPSSFELAVFVVVLAAFAAFAGSTVVFFARLALNW